jgi:hypothetical protein
VQRVLPAMLAMLFGFQAGLQELLIFPGKIIDLFALGALEFDHVVL